LHARRKDFPAFADIAIALQEVWPISPAIIFHDRGKIFTSERARQVLVDRLGIITEQAPPYAPSAKARPWRWPLNFSQSWLPDGAFSLKAPMRNLSDVICL
jgi:hypothetical protein